MGIKDIILTIAFHSIRSVNMGTVYFTRILLLLSTRYAHTLCFKQTGEIDNLIVSWEQSIWLCCVQVPRCYWLKTRKQVIVNNALVRASRS
jgi:hypothetical protein